MVAVSLILGLSLAIGGAAGFIGATSGTLGKEISYWIQGQRQAYQPEAKDLIVLRIRGIITPEEYLTLMSREGYNAERSDLFLRGAEQLLGAGDLITLFRRGHIESEELLEGFIKLGFSSNSLDKLLLSSEYFPAPADLVRFAVREVYTPGIVTKFGLDAELPEEFITEAAKAGIPAEQARNYWRAKWILPSVEMGYEMLHRDIIDADTLDLLFRTQDVMPYWREKLKAISYVPYTRVDVRRMYQFGILDKNAVFRSYKDIGYDDEKAEKMTEFTIAYVEPDERELTKAMIIEGLKQGEITREETIAFMGSIGYDAENADYILSLEENKWSEAETKNQIDALTTLFKGGLMTQEDYIAELDKLNLKASYRNKLVASAMTVKRAEAKLPTKEDIKDWYTKEIISKKLFSEYYDKLGYSKEDIAFYLNEIFLAQLEATETKAIEVKPTLIPRATLTSLFIEGTITEDRLRGGLTELHFRPEDVETLIDSALLKQAELSLRLDAVEQKALKANPKLLPRSKLESLYLEGTINETTLREKLTELGFRDVDIELLVTSANYKLEVKGGKAE